MLLGEFCNKADDCWFGNLPVGVRNYYITHCIWLMEAVNIDAVDFQSSGSSSYQQKYTSSCGQHKKSSIELNDFKLQLYFLTVL